MIINHKSYLSIVAYVFAFFCAVTLTGCKDSNDPETTSGNQTSTKKTINDRNKDEIIAAIGVEEATGYDPIKGWGENGDVLFQSKLLDVNSDNELVGDLAVEYKVSDDKLIWTFKLRNDVKFHDGQKLTAKDVAFTYNKMKDSGTSVDLSRLEKVEAPDDTTVIFTMSSPVSIFAYQAAIVGIVPEHAYGDGQAYATKPIGSGPYKFVQWDRGQQLIVERNDDYYGGKASFKKIVFLFMSDDAAYAALKAGTVEIAKTTEELAEKPVEGYKLVNFETVDYRAISMPMQKSGGKSTDGHPVGNDVTSDLTIRKALALGLNRKEMIDSVLEGNGIPVFSIAHRLPWENKDVQLKDGDIEAAKTMLEKDGWLIQTDGVRAKNGLKAEFHLAYMAGDTNRESIAMAVSEQAKKLGISVIPDGLSSADFEANKYKDAFVLGGGNFAPIDLYNSLNSKFAANGSWTNIVSYKNEKVDEYLSAAISAKTPEEANEFWRKAQWDGSTGGSVIGDTPYIYLMYVNHPFFIRDGLDLGKQKYHPHDHGFVLISSVMNWKYTQ